MRATWCRDCQTPILTGLDEDVCAIGVRVDVTPLDALGEMLAALSTPPRPTYTLVVLAGKPARLVRRRWWSHTPWPIAGMPNRHYDVVPGHVCGATLPAVPTRLAPQLAVRGVCNEPCPF